MASEVEIDQLAADLFGSDQAEQVLADAVCKATEAREWDEVVKWNRVRWRLRMMARAAGKPSSPLTAISAGP